MSALLGVIIRTSLQVLAGLGIGNLLDKFVKPKVPAAYYPEPIGMNFKVPRLLWILFAFVAAVLIVRFVGRKFKLKLLK